MSNIQCDFALSSHRQGRSQSGQSLHQLLHTPANGPSIETYPLDDMLPRSGSEYDSWSCRLAETACNSFVLHARTLGHHRKFLQSIHARKRLDLQTRTGKRWISRSKFYDTGTNPKLCQQTSSSLPAIVQKVIQNPTCIITRMSRTGTWFACLDLWPT